MAVFWSRLGSWLPSNPLLLREVRVVLRNVRSFALLAIYVSLLGALVAANFPGEQSIDIEADGGGRGYEVFNWLMGGQFALILLLIPSLSTGALAQERERGTLQTLLLTPLSPLQIVWGKAGGVLSLVGLMLLASAPVTSLCFLLGGVSGGQLLAGYATIFGFAILTTGFGLYCAARYPNPTRALLVCYGMLPLVAFLVLVASLVGSIIAGLFSLALVAYGFATLWKRGENKSLGKKLGNLYSSAVYPAATLVVLAILWWMFVDRANFGAIVVGLAFVLMYFVMVTQYGMRLTAIELLRRADPEASWRQKVDDWRTDLRTDWQSAVAVRADEATRGPNAPMERLPSHVSERSSSFGAKAYLPGENTTSTASASAWQNVETTRAVPSNAATHPTSNAAAPSTLTRAASAVAPNATYGKSPFLSDRLNPIFARELRGVFDGRWGWLWRLGYVVVIASEVLLLLWLIGGLLNPSWLILDVAGALRPFALLHLMILCVLGAWFGARSVAREREGQTLPQLFVIPMRPFQIIAGKAGAALVLAALLWFLPLPLVLLLGLLDLVPLGLALRFVLVEMAVGFFAVAWGVWCSFHMMTVRRALSTTLTGIGILLVAPYVVTPLLELLQTLDVPGGEFVRYLATVAPMVLAYRQPNSYAAFSSMPAFATNAALSSGEWLALLGYVVVGWFLLWITARGFLQLARSGEANS